LGYTLKSVSSCAQVEKQIFDLETTLLTQDWQQGKRAAVESVKPEDRIFSLSSATSPLGPGVPFPSKATSAAATSASAASTSKK
jgi:hypothetical protein